MANTQTILQTDKRKKGDKDKDAKMRGASDVM